MYIRPITVTKNGKRHGYWALVESYRTRFGPHQRVVSYLGQIDESSRCGIHRKAFGQGHQRMLFDDVEPAWVEVNVHDIRVENCLEFGGSWLGLELLKKLGLAELFERFMPAGRESVPWSLVAQVMVIARLCEPCSELHIAEHFYKDTVLCDLLGISVDKINDDRLYRTLDKLLPHKEQLEVHLKERMGSLFKLEYDILLYDVTSTYFEGQAVGNSLAKRGYSRDHRPDCKQVCIGLVVKCCLSPDSDETFILCRSQDRRKKEQAMHERFEKRIEEGLKKIGTACTRQKCDPVTIAKRVGRLLGQNSRAAGLFKTDVIKTVDGCAKLL